MNEWQTAYATIAEVAATLSGLLFVSLSLRLNAASSEERRWILLVAKRSFFDFLAVLLIGLCFLVPGISRYVVGWGLLWLSLARVIWHVSHWRWYRSSELPNTRLVEYVAPMVLTSILVVAGVSVLEAYAFASRLIYVAVVALLIGACQNAWRLLVR